METSFPSLCPPITSSLQCEEGTGKTGVNYSLNAYLGAVGPSAPSPIFAFLSFGYHPLSSSSSRTGRQPPLSPLSLSLWSYLLWEKRNRASQSEGEARKSKDCSNYTRWSGYTGQAEEGGGGEREGAYTVENISWNPSSEYLRSEPRNLSSPLCTNAAFPFLGKWIRPGFIG